MAWTCSECNDISDETEFVFSFEDDSEHKVCQDCMEKLRTELALVEPFGQWFVVQDGNTRLIFDSVEDLSKYSVSPTAKFGFAKWLEWPEDCQKAWLGEGSVPVSEVTAKTIQSFATKDAGGFFQIGFRNHIVPGKVPGKESKDMVSTIRYGAVMTLSDLLSPEHVQEVFVRFQKYVQEHHLEDSSVLLTSDEDLLPDFCDPQSPSMAWFDSISDLKKGRWDGSFVEDVSTVSWKRTKKWLTRTIDKLQEEIDQRQAQIEELKEFLED